MLKEKYSPLYFLAALGAGGLSVSFFMYLILKADSHYDRMAIYILLIGNLHYPVLFYLTMVFVLPLLIYKVLYVKFTSNESRLIRYP